MVDNILMNNMKKVLLFTTLLIVIFVISGCEGKNVTMTFAPKGKKIEKPKSGKAKIVFMRASMLAAARNFSIFEIVDGKPLIVSILPAYGKSVHELEPGKHIFMVNLGGASSGLMEVTTQEGKTYYSYMKMHSGMFSGSTSFQPYDKSVSIEDINEYLNSCDLVVMNDKTNQWAKIHQKDILANYKEALEEWNDENDKDRVRLYAEDGR